MNERRYLDAIANEEDRNVVANHVKVALPCVELHGESTRITQGLRAASLVDHSGEANNHRGLHTRCPQEIGARQVRDIMCHFKESLGARASRMHHSLGDTLPIELGQFLHQVVVFQQHWAAGTDRRRVVVVPYWRARVRGPERSVVLAGWPILQSQENTTKPMSELPLTASQSQQPKHKNSPISQPQLSNSHNTDYPSLITNSP